MKYLLPTILLFINIPAFGQKIIVDLYFFDTCKDSTHSIEYTLIGENGIYLSKGSTVEIDSAGWYVVTSGFGVGEDKIETIIDRIEVKSTSRYIDTIFVARIRLRSLSTLYASKAKYYNCDVICNGYEEDYFSNGNIKTKGKYINGLPIEISQFRENGTLEYKEFYKLGKFLIERIEYYDENGKLKSYEIHKYKRKKTIIKNYDGTGKLLKKEIYKKK